MAPIPQQMQQLQRVPARDPAIDHEHVGAVITHSNAGQAMNPAVDPPLTQHG
jgi:hypothetical protein